MAIDSIEAQVQPLLIDSPFPYMNWDDEYYHWGRWGKSSLSVTTALERLWTIFCGESTIPVIWQEDVYFDDGEADGQDMLCLFAKMLVMADDKGILPYQQWKWKPLVNKHKCIYIQAFLVAIQYFKELGLFHGVKEKYQFICPKGVEFTVDGYLDQMKEAHSILCLHGNIFEQKEKEDYSTLRMPTEQRPSFPLGNVCGKYERYPLGPTDWEGGLRTKGIYKKDCKEFPLITYITVVYNRVNVIAECMKSIWEQTYPNIEYIIIDGGSTDGTLELLKQYEDKIDYCISQPDTGILNAMNKGISLASGHFICFMNSDDLCAQNAAMTVAEHYHKTNAEFITGRRMLMKEDRTLISEPMMPRYRIRNAVIHVMPVHHQATYSGRSLFEEHGYLEEDFRFIADYKWESSCITTTDNICFVDEILATFYMGGLTGTTSQLERWKEWTRLVHTTFPTLPVEKCEELFYGNRLFWRYVDFKTLFNSIKKYLVEPKLRRCVYETGWFTTYTLAFHLEQLQKQVPAEKIRLQETLTPLLSEGGEELDILAYIDQELQKFCSCDEFFPSEDDFKKLIWIKGKLNSSFLKTQQLLSKPNKSKTVSKWIRWLKLLGKNFCYQHIISKNSALSLQFAKKPYL